MLVAYGVRPMMFRLPAVAATPCAAKSSIPTTNSARIVVTMERYTISSITKMTPIDTNAIFARLLCPASLRSALSTVLPAT